MQGALLGMCMMAGLAAPAEAQLTADAHEQAPRIELDRVFPENLMQSDSYRVEDNLRIKGTLFEFTLDSNHGRYDVLSIPMTIVRIHEIRTLAQAVDAFQRNNLQLAAELRGVVFVGRESSVDILNSPLAPTGPAAGQYANNNVLQTINEITQRSGSQVQRGGEANKRPGSENMYETWVPEDPILASYKRSIASHLDLDIYSSNSRVQAFLDILARARGGGDRSAGNITVSIPNPPEISVDGGRIEFAVRTAMARNTVRQVYIENEKALQSLGIEPELYHAFLSHPAYSPRHKTAITAYLVYMADVDNRSEFLRAALEATDEVSALGYARMARMLAYYHEHTEKLKGLVSGGSVLMATTAGKNMALVLPFDLLWWSDESDRVFSSLARFSDENGFKLRELLLIGVTSRAARAQLERLKFTVREKYLLRR
jgi:hypothetical protein